MRITKKLIVTGTGVLALAVGGGAAYAATVSTPSSTSVSPLFSAPLSGSLSGAAADSAAAPATAPKVTAEQAMRIAHQAVPGAWVRELDFDRRGSRADVWELELTKGTQQYEVDVDATSGKVVKHEIDRHHDDDD